jgi:hypothetical protein
LLLLVLLLVLLLPQLDLPPVLHLDYQALQHWSYLLVYWPWCWVFRQLAVWPFDPLLLRLLLLDLLRVRRLPVLLQALLLVL